ncbi:MAG: methyltransferase domain-containing protein [Bacteroidota bacterium]
MMNKRINIAEHTEFTEVVDIKRLNFIADMIQTYCQTGARILDIGCGNGNIARGIGSLGYTVKGIDFSNAAINYATSRNKADNVTFCVQSAEEVTSGEQYDAIICSEVLEHLNQPSSLVKIIARILKPGGVLIATVPNGTGPREMLVTRPVQAMNKTWMGKMIDGSKKAMGYANATVQSHSEDLTHVQFFTRSAISSLIETEGFELLKFCHSNSIEKVFPYSMLTRHVKALSKFDNKMVDYLPSIFASGFNTAWIRKA